MTTEQLLRSLVYLYDGTVHIRYMFPKRLSPIVTWRGVSGKFCGVAIVGNAGTLWREDFRAGPLNLTDGDQLQINLSNITVVAVNRTSTIMTIGSLFRKRELAKLNWLSVGF